MGINFFQAKTQLQEDLFEQQLYLDYLYDELVSTPAMIAAPPKVTASYHPTVLISLFGERALWAYSITFMIASLGHVYQKNQFL